MSAPPISPVVKLGVRPPYELVCSPAFLLKRLGWAIKDRTFAAFEAAFLPGAGCGSNRNAFLLRRRK